MTTTSPLCGMTRMSFGTTVQNEQRAHLGSFEHLPNQANSTTQFILINLNPIILLYRPNGQNLRLSVASIPSGAAENSESE